MQSAFGAIHIGVEPTALSGPPPCDGELLARLFQLVSVLPLARYPSQCLTPNFTAAGSIEFLLDEHNAAIDPSEFTPLLAVRVALRLRQKLLPYMYSQTVLGHLAGRPVIRPLYAEWQSHPLWASRHQTFLIGEHLVVRPILEHNPMRVLVSTPDFGERWFSVYDGRETTSNVIETMTAADLVHGMPMALRGGSVVPLLMTRKSNALATRHDAIHLVVSLGVHNTSRGTLYLDDGTGNKALFRTGKYVFIDMVYELGKLTLTPLARCPRDVDSGVQNCVERNAAWRLSRPVHKITINGLGSRTVLGALKPVWVVTDTPNTATRRVQVPHKIAARSVVVAKPGITLDGRSTYVVEMNVATPW